MSRSQLPLNALRAFEAAARHASFTHAAEELHVTQAAVSHQVKALEERLGVALFVRRPRGLEITGEGQALLPDLRDAFDRMTNALERVGRKANSGTLNVSLINGFTPVTGDSFQVLNYGSHSGAFATINGNGQAYTPTYGATNLTTFTGPTPMASSSPLPTIRLFSRSASWRSGSGLRPATRASRIST